MDVDNKMAVARMADLETLADYFEGQAWHESWPADVILALARVKYPHLAPFRLVLDHVLVDDYESVSSGEMFYMQDIRDKDENHLPSTKQVT